MKRKSGQEIKEAIIKILKEKNEASINEIRQKTNSNWSTIKKYGEKLERDYPIIEKKYKQVFDGFKMRELSESEKKILNLVMNKKNDKK